MRLAARDGEMECWSIGVLECWSAGVLEGSLTGRITPSFQHSITPVPPRPVPTRPGFLLDAPLTHGKMFIMPIEAPVAPKKINLRRLDIMEAVQA